MLSSDADTGDNREIWSWRGQAREQALMGPKSGQEKAPTDCSMGASLSIKQATIPIGLEFVLPGISPNESEEGKA